MAFRGADGQMYDDQGNPIASTLGHDPMEVGGPPPAPYQDWDRQLQMFGNPSGFQNIWAAAGGHGIDSPTNFGFGNFEHLNKRYGDAAARTLWNAAPNAYSNDFANFVVRPDLAHVGNRGSFYQTDANKLYNWFQKNAPEGLQDQEVWNYLNAMDAAGKSAGGHERAFQQAQAKRTKQTTAAALAGVLGPAGAAGGALAAGAIGGLTGYGLGGGDWRSGLKGALGGGLGSLAAGAASNFAGGGLGGKVLGSLASSATKQGLGALLSNPRTGGSATAPQGSRQGTSGLGAEVVAPVAAQATQDAVAPQFSPLAQAVTSGSTVSPPASNPRLIRLTPGFRRGY